MRERHVELDHIGQQGQDVTEAGEAGSGVIDREPPAARSEVLQRLEQFLVVGHLGVLGDLEHDPASLLVPEATGNSLRRDGVGRQIHGQVPVIGEPIELLQASGQGGLLQLDAQPHRLGFFEPLARPPVRRWSEPSQSLDTLGSGTTAAGQPPSIGTR